MFNITKNQIVIAAVLALGGLIAWLFVARASLKADLAEATAQLTICRQANADWTAAIARSDAAHEAEKKMLVQRTAEVQKARRAALTEMVKHKHVAEDMMRRPKGQAEPCLETQRLVDLYWSELP